jgi:hypothetical protein
MADCLSAKWEIIRQSPDMDLLVQLCDTFGRGRNAIFVLDKNRNRSILYYYDTIETALEAFRGFQDKVSSFFCYD